MLWFRLKGRPATPSPSLFSQERCVSHEPTGKTARPDRTVGRGRVHHLARDQRGGLLFLARFWAPAPFCRRKEPCQVSPCSRVSFSTLTIRAMPPTPPNQCHWPTPDPKHSLCFRPQRSTGSGHLPRSPHLHTGHLALGLQSAGKGTQPTEAETSPPPSSSRAGPQQRLGREGGNPERGAGPHGPHLEGRGQGPAGPLTFHPIDPTAEKADFQIPNLRKIK